jgi:hypothetical protein
MNTSFDLYSKAPIRKFELLELFKQEFGLRYSILDRQIENYRTGVKLNYYSENRSAAGIGFSPNYTSLETVLSESKIILSQQ